MGEDKKTPINIDGTEYLFEDLTQEQQAYVNHVADLDRKIANSQFNLEQLQFGRDAFMKGLKDVLEKETQIEEVIKE